MADRSFKFVEQAEKVDNEQLRPSLTYWQDAWRRLKKNKLAMAGLIGVIAIIIFGILGPFFTPYSYEEQVLDHANLPPKFEVTQVNENEYIFLARDYKMMLVDEDGNILRRLEAVDKDVINKIYTYDYNENGEEDAGDVVLDFSYRTDPTKANLGIDFTLEFEGTIYDEVTGSIGNNTYKWGTDNLGRDIQTRVMFGARISLTVALAATLVNLLIGVTYGSIAGYVGGTTDNIMMHGAWGEASPATEELLTALATAGAERHWRAMRCPDPDAAVGPLAWMLRRRWALTALRENARLKLERLEFVGRGSAAAVSRRTAAQDQYAARARRAAVSMARGPRALMRPGA